MSIRYGNLAITDSIKTIQDRKQKYTLVIVLYLPNLTSASRPKMKYKQNVKKNQRKYNNCFHHLYGC